MPELAASIHQIRGSETKHFAGFAPLKLRPGLQSGEPHPECLLLGLYVGSSPAGLLIAFTVPATDRMQFSSVAVARPYRRRGLATLLLRRLEEEAAARGCEQLQLIYLSTKDVPEAFQGLLRRSGWPDLEFTHLCCTSDYHTLSQAPWMRDLTPSADFHCGFWADLPIPERQRLQRKQRQLSYVPFDLDPFEREEEIDKRTSLALWHHGEVVGWCISRRLDEVTGQCAILFVEQQFQGAGRAIWLLAHSVRLTRNMTMQQFVFDVKLERRGMLRFVERRMQPFLTGSTRMGRVAKQVEVSRPAPSEPIPLFLSGEQTACAAVCG